ncbi:hypothetical protein G3480_25255 [Thiorhodococcus mannitoliphagus]|uniref:Uncharacterized protein n=1 Tax=Thiorhodococcus mannitoliphagus TaxID=329406 RepID=A0A6P1DYZ8_9GAMM|nr:hypothetical protein [Thiorhodococcus mannitoliphagus]NEX23547.1 hypothetical protein [Thiorhodococcus mannitoliphagus]
MSESNPRDLTRQDSDDSRRDGLSIETAIVIRAEHASIGVAMEYDTVTARHGAYGEAWTLASQRLRLMEDRRYDILRILLKTGEEVTYFLDITEWYGKDESQPNLAEIAAWIDDDDADWNIQVENDEGALPPQASADRQGDGHSLETAVVIHAQTIWSSVCEECDFLILKHGPLADWTAEFQACFSRNARHYDRIEVIPRQGEPQTYYFDVTKGYEDGLHEVSMKQGLMRTRRNPGAYLRVMIDTAATARVFREPEAAALWAEAVALVNEQFERRQARRVLADALLTTRRLMRE